MSKINKCGVIFSCNGTNYCKFSKKTIPYKFCDYLIPNRPHNGCCCNDAIIEKLEKLLNVFKNGGNKQ